MRLVARAGATSLGLLALLVPSARAHGLVGRADLPVPVWLFVWAAAIVLVASFVALALLWKEPLLQKIKEKPLFPFGIAADVIGGLLGIFAFGMVVYAGLAGANSDTGNLAPTVIYVTFWVGFPIASVLFGDVFSLFNPWRAFGRFVGWVAANVAPQLRPRQRSYPTWLGNWPAVLGIFLFTWLELNYSDKDNPYKLAWIAIVYALIQLVAMLFFGVRTWSDRGDSFGVYFNLYSRISVLVRRNGKVCFRPPLSGLPGLPVMAGTVGLLCVAIGSTSFDGFSNGKTWRSIQSSLISFFHSLGFGTVGATEAAGTVGLLGCILIVAGLYHTGIWGMQSVDATRSVGELARWFIHTLTPIAFAYLLAHYFSLFVFQNQALAYLISDPLGHGSNIFGTAHSQIDYGAVSSNLIWYVQVGALVVGHVAALTLAHDRALAVYTRVKEATASQFWMLGVMVAFTCIGLWLLSAVNT